jgi:putative transposase
MPCNRGGRRKYLLQCHLIFVVKYRKRLLTTYGDCIKSVFKIQEVKSSSVVETVEVDKDHIHLLLSYEP